jgi:phosphoribosylformylglycinamidine cyclo-ligase
MKHSDYKLDNSLRYLDLGVSSSKNEILEASKAQKGELFSGAFCKINYIPSLDSYISFHSDGAGTKSIIAYLDYCENGDPSIFSSLAQDALVMNLDDLLCIGSRGPFFVTNTIGRNLKKIPPDAIKAIIEGYEFCAEQLSKEGIEIQLCGGETADVGDLVRTVIVDASVFCTLSKNEIIDGAKVRPGDLIIGLSSSGKASYEDIENSGIGSNGLTFARHTLLKKEYLTNFPEISSPEITSHLSYSGNFSLSDVPERLRMNVSQALLSPTRTYSPIVIKAFREVSEGIHGIVHCTGGGQAKCARLGDGIRYIKDNLFDPPEIFKLIRKEASIGWREMYQVFNMGHRMELFVDPASANEIISISKSFNVDAKIIGICQRWNNGPKVILDNVSIGREKYKF